MATYNDGKGYNMGTGAAHVAAGINRVSAVTVDAELRNYHICSCSCRTYCTDCSRRSGSY